MKLIKQIVLSTLVALGIFCAVFYTSCSKDACKGVTCLNNGTCRGGSCTCVDSGTGGANCEIIYRQLYAGQGGAPQTYLGNAVISYTRFDSASLDSGYINHTDAGNTLVFSYSSSDTIDNKMTLAWKDGANQIFSTPIFLQNNTATGSTFTIPSTSVTLPTSISRKSGTFKLTGNGSVSTTNASLNITAVPVDSTTPTIYFTLSNCSKQ